jgi:hypothetical protein
VGLDSRGQGASAVAHPAALSTGYQVKGELYGVAATSRGNAWAVGETGTPKGAGHQLRAALERQVLELTGVAGRPAAGSAAAPRPGAP